VRLGKIKHEFLKKIEKIKIARVWGTSVAFHHILRETTHAVLISMHEKKEMKTIKV
jgi:hypothetical protein